MGTTNAQVDSAAETLGIALGLEKVYVQGGSKINGVSWFATFVHRSGETWTERLGMTKTEAYDTLRTLHRGVDLVNRVARNDEKAAAHGNS